jgi:phosphate starvation-inducible protein PhoH and related proteins
VSEPIQIELQTLDEARDLCGLNDCNIALIRERLSVGIYTRNGSLRIDGLNGSADKAAEILRTLLEDLRAGRQIGPERIADLLPKPKKNLPHKIEGLIGRLGVNLRSDGQTKYIEKVEKHDLTFCIGPAGTGKTFLAVAAAVRALKDGHVEKIVLCRPAVEAGEHLGFLPGDLQAKINPFLRPLYDSLYAVLDFDTVKRYQEREVIEIAPLAYMRGRTLSRAFIILDEGQNTTRSQMKMFLTRMGENSRIIVTGDTTQIDLPKDTPSGLIHAKQLLNRVKGIAFHEMTGKDIVRHRLVRDIVSAYADNLKHGKNRR